MCEVYIYGLVDPRSGELRYIGKTNDLKRRLRDHYVRARSPKFPVNYWIRSLRKQGLKPEIIVLATVRSDSWDAAEISIIADHRASGANLLNLSSGGEGHSVPGLAGERNPRAVLNRVAVELLRQVYAEGQIEIEVLARQFEISPTQARRIISGKSWKDAGGPISTLPGTAKGSKHRQSKLNEQDVLTIRELFAATPINQAELAEKYNVSISTISLIVQGKKWVHVGGPITNPKGATRHRRRATAIAEAAASVAGGRSD